MRVSYANVVASLALILAVGGTALASSIAGSSAPATLKLCVAKKGGDLRLLSGGGKCKAREKALTVDRQGTRGVAGPAGPGGPQGPAGITTSLASPNGQFTVAATNGGIVLTGPNGSVTFDGEEILSDADLKITAPQKLTLVNGTALDITSGLTTSFTTGVNFTETVGGTYNQSVGAGYVQSVGNAFTQNIGSGYNQVIGGSYDQSLTGGFKQRVGTTYDAQSGGQALLSGSTVRLGGSSCSLAAARVGSVVNGFSQVTATGSSPIVFVC